MIDHVVCDGVTACNSGVHARSVDGNAAGNVTVHIVRSGRAQLSVSSTRRDDLRVGTGKGDHRLGGIHHVDDTGYVGWVAGSVRTL